MDKKILDVLLKIARQLQNKGLTWALTGSTNFAIQGVKVTTDDIDIQTDKDSAYKIEEIFQAYSINPVRFSSDGRIRSHFGSLEIDGVSIEIMGDIEKLVDGTWEKTPELHEITRFVHCQNMNIPVLALEYEADAYRKLGREDKATLLEEFLTNGKVNA